MKNREMWRAIESLLDWAERAIIQEDHPVDLRSDCRVEWSVAGLTIEVWEVGEREIRLRLGEEVFGYTPRTPFQTWRINRFCRRIHRAQGESNRAAFIEIIRGITAPKRADAPTNDFSQGESRREHPFPFSQGAA